MRNNCSSVAKCVQHRQGATPSLVRGGFGRSLIGPRRSRELPDWLRRRCVGGRQHLINDITTEGNFPPPRTPLLPSASIQGDLPRPFKCGRRSCCLWKIRRSFDLRCRTSPSSSFSSLPPCLFLPSLSFFSSFPLFLSLSARASFSRARGRMGGWTNADDKT